MTRYTLHVPEQYNDGTPVGPETLATIEDRLVGIGGGFTLTHGIGAWRGDDGTIYREPVRLYSVDNADPHAGLWLHELAQGVRQALRQEAVYLTAAEIAPTLVYA